MININIPNNNINERKYIIDILFNEFLGLEYNSNIINNAEGYEVILDNGSILYVNDNFFSKYKNYLEYLNINHLPNNVLRGENNFLDIEYIVLYGSDSISINKNIIKFDFDIFASSFFMLTRWEEFVVKDRDEHNRFLGKFSIAYKYNFIEKPIVNEYVEMLWNMLKYLDISLNRKKSEYSLLLTHDVDLPFRYNKFIDMLKYSVKDFLFSKSIMVFFKTIKEIILVKIKIKKDPIDTFDLLMDIAEDNNVKSYFFFMAKGLTKYDNRYRLEDEKIYKLIENIQERGHYIGIHPTYNAYDNNIQFKKELKELNKYIKKDIIFGREHYLRFSVPTTWQIWENNNMKWDSTLCYADMVGFRSGICYEYSVFNILDRKKLSLKEKPLIVMETTLFEYQKLSNEEGLTKIKSLIDTVKKYNGEFVILWHNHSFNSYFWSKYQEVYINLFKKKEKKC